VRQSEVDSFNKCKLLCILQNVDAFKLIMSGAGGGSNEKRLASQFIARFHKYFPSLFDKCLDVMMDLCEDVDVAVSSALYHCYFVNKYVLIISGTVIIT